MKTSKRILTIFLILVMLFQCVPIVYATDNGNSNVSGDSIDANTESNLTAENGMGHIIKNLTAAESEDGNYPGGYNILGILFDENTASVNLNVSDSCKLVVAIYDENTSEMLCSATKVLSASVFSEEHKEDIINVEMDIAEMPEYFLAKAFILDENNNALCKHHVCRAYTTAYKVFIETTPDDFAGKEILTFDDNCDDFGVLVDGAVAVQKPDTMTYTYSNGVYTFHNATSEVKSLKSGDIFCCELSDEIGDFLLIKVKDIKVSGATVEITEDEDIALGDAFQFVRIDADADFSDVELDEEKLGSALSLQEPEKQVKRMSARAEIDTNETKTFKTQLNIGAPDNSENGKEDDSAFSAEGRIAYSLTVSAKLYYDYRFLENDFYEFSTTLTHGIDIFVDLKGKTPNLKDYFGIPFPSIPLGAILKLDLTVYPIISAEGKITFGSTIEVYNNISLTDSNGVTSSNDSKWFGFDPEIGETEIEIKIGVGCEVDLGIKKGKEDVDGMAKLHAALSASLEGGLKAVFKPSLIGVLIDKHHNCTFCLEGSIAAFAEINGTIELKIITDKLKFKWDIFNGGIEATAKEYYLSISEKGVKFAQGTCPNIAHEVTVVVYDKYGTLVKDAVVSTKTGYCDAENDKEFDDTSMTTNENGKAVFYFAKGEHELIAKKDGLGTSGQQFEILSNPKTIHLQFVGAEYINGHYYMLYDDVCSSWQEAKVYCEKLGGHLAIIDSKEENDALHDYVTSSGYPNAYFGLTDSQKEGEWLTVYGTVPSYINWHIDEPNNDNKEQSEEHYAQFFYIYEDGTWNDGNFGKTPIDNGKTFICEWESMPTFDQPSAVSSISFNSINESQSKSKTFASGTVATYINTIKGTEYVLAVIKDENAAELISADNLLYIDQKTADGDAISFEFVLPEGVSEYTVKIFGISHHTKEIIYGKAPTCKDSGLTNGTKCSSCGEILEEQTVIPTVDHIDENGDHKCDYGCGYEFNEDAVTKNPNEEGNCNHICHKDGFLGFIWKIIRFFVRLFGAWQFCDCGVEHW